MSEVTVGSFEPKLEISPTSLEKMLLKDFYLSFKFSQGKGYIQRRLFIALSTAYRRTLDEQAIDQIGRDVATILSPTKLASLRQPIAHKEVPGADRTDVVDEFQEKGEKFIKYISPIPMNTKIDCWTICNHLVDRDLVYQNEESGYQASDKHASYFREYVVLGQSTGSVAFDTIFAESAVVSRLGSAPSDLPGLIKAWHTTHPGQQFYPETIQTS